MDIAGFAKQDSKRICLLQSRFYILYQNSERYLQAPMAYLKRASFLEILIYFQCPENRDRTVSEGTQKLRILDRNTKLKCLRSISWQQINLLAPCPRYLQQKALLSTKRARKFQQVLITYSAEENTGHSFKYKGKISPSFSAKR